MFCALLSGGTLSMAGGLEGDAEAIARVQLMLEAIGGREVWASARSLYIVERARHPDYGDSIIASFWRDLEEPGEFARFSSEKMEVKYAWNEDGGWIQRNTELRDFEEKEMAERLFYWPREIYTLYHQLALGKRQLTVKALEHNGIAVLDEQGEQISEFRLTPEGDPYYWAQHGGKQPVAYVYGPHKDFGRISFPDWGASTDGDWGFYYVQVRPSQKPFGAHVDLTKPNLGWSGGAINR